MREVAPGVPPALVNALFAIVPNFSNFDFKNRVAYGDAVPAALLGWMTLYAAGLDRGGARARPRRVPRAGLQVSLAPARCCCSRVAVARAASQARIDVTAGRFRAQEEVLYLWSGEHVKRLVPGFENLAADLYWLRTVQYFGGQRLFVSDKRFELLRPLIDITTTLDPRLEIAYRYGAIFLSEPPPLGAGRPREGVEVLERGVSALPDSWRLRQDLGFFHFLFLGDAHTASRDPGRGVADSGRRLLAAHDGGRPAGEGRRSRQLAPHVAADVRAGGGRHHPGERAACACRSSTRSTSADALAAAVAEFERRHGQAAGTARRARGPGPVARAAQGRRRLRVRL